MLKRILQSTVLQQLWAVIGGVSIRVKVLGIVVGAIVLLGIFITLQLRLVLTDRLSLDLATQGQALVEHLAAQLDELMTADSTDNLRQELEDYQHHYSNPNHNTLVDYLTLLDDAGQLLTTTGETVSLSRLDSAATLPQNGGTLHLGLSTLRIETAVNEITFQIFSVTLIMVAFGFAAAFFLTWILTRPIMSLVEGTQAVAAGDFSQRVRRWANDEIGDLADAFNAMTAALGTAEQERHEQERLRTRYLTGVITAQENERQRIARELHDSTSQSLTSLLVGLKNLNYAENATEHDQRLEALRQVVAQTLDEVRTLAWTLRPSVLDDLGLISALEHYIHDYQARYGVQVDFISKGITSRLPGELETTIYRIIQEGLTNIARYAQAKSVSVILDQRPASLRLIIEDDGIGFNPGAVQGKSLGLQGIRERASLFGGSLTIESTPGSGTSLFVEIPLTQEQE